MLILLQGGRGISGEKNFQHFMWLCPEISFFQTLNEGGLTGVIVTSDCESYISCPCCTLIA